MEVGAGLSYLIQCNMGQSIGPRCGHPTVSGGKCKNLVPKAGQWCGRCKPPVQVAPERHSSSGGALRARAEQAASVGTFEPAGLGRAGLIDVLESAARLQEVVPDAVLVGGSAAALWADHRTSLDHDHVLNDLADRFEVVLEAVESTDGWVTNRVAPGKIILGELGGIESGVRQLIRRRPLEVTEVGLPSGRRIRVPTPDETLRVKAYLIVRRNQTRDYLDVAALADRYGEAHAGAVLAHLDDYYADQRAPDALGVASQLVGQLADPRPKDPLSASELRHYKGLAARWADWSEVVRVCRTVAVMVVEQPR